MKLLSRRAERGYNLIEVLIATGLLGTVILTIVTLFYMGRKNVYSGKELTHAVATSTRVAEDVSAMSVSDLYTAFNITGATTLGTVTVNATGTKKGGLQYNSYNGSILRTTDTISTATDTGGFLQRWKDEMVNNRKFENPTVALVITPRNPNPTTASPITPANATVVRVRMIVRWEEGLSARQLILDTVKTNRPLPD